MKTPTLGTDRRREGWGADVWIVLGCLICQVGMGVGGYIVPVFLKPIAEELQWSRTVYSLGHPIMSTSVALLAPLVGWLADRHGARPVLVFGAFSMSAALLGLGAMESAGQFFALSVVLGVAVACLGDLPTGAAIAGRFEERRGLALASVYIGSSIGGSIGPLIATALAAMATWRFGLGSMGAGLLFLLLPAALLVGPKRAPPEGAGAEEEQRSQAAPSVAKLVRTRDFWLLFWAVFAFYFYRLGVNAHLVAHLSDLGYSDRLAAGGFSLMLGVGIASKLLSGGFADRIGARAAALGNFGLLILSSVLLLLPASATVLGAFLLLHGFATAAEDVVVPLLVARRFGAGGLATVYGLLMLALVPGGSLGPVLAGWVFDHFGSYAPAFGLFALGNVTAVFALAAVRASAGGSGGGKA